MSDKPWFIRIKSPMNYRLEPYSTPGWIATGVFVAGAIGFGASSAAWVHSRAGWIAWGAIFATWTISYLVLAFRNSEAASVELQPRNRRRR